MRAINAAWNVSHANAPASCRLTAIPNARDSHGSANSSSPLVRGGAAGPSTASGAVTAR